MSAGRRRRERLWFEAAGRVRVRDELLDAPDPHEIQVVTTCSAISMGTEGSVHRGEIHPDTSMDASPVPGGETFEFPFPYGYACVGRVAAMGSQCHGELRAPREAEAEGEPELELGSRVFAFHAHASAFNVARAAVIPIPDWMPDERALFLPNMETAVTLILDGRPQLGERVGLWGLGSVGLLSTALLLDFPIAQLRVYDPRPNALAAVRDLAATHATRELEFSAQTPAEAADGQLLDLAFELSSNPAALQLAIDGVEVEGRVVVGSWYGQRSVQLDLGRNFHRRRTRLLSSQVSRLPGRLGPAWSFARRWAVVMMALRRVHPELWIDDRRPFRAAPDAYRQLNAAQRPLQTIFRYSDGEG